MNGPDFGDRLENVGDRWEIEYVVDDVSDSTTFQSMSVPDLPFERGDCIVLNDTELEVTYRTFYLDEHRITVELRKV